MELASCALPPTAAGDSAAAEARLLSLAAAVESATRHPLAAAVQAAAQRRGLALPAVAQASTTPGSGACARVHAFVGAQGVLACGSGECIRLLCISTLSGAPELQVCFVQLTEWNARALACAYYACATPRPRCATPIAAC